MEREDRLCYCKVCSLKKMDFKRGIVCQLTNEYADFEGSCDQFQGDEFEQRKLSQARAIEKREIAEARAILEKETSPKGIILSIIGLLISIALIAFRCSRM